MNYRYIKGAPHGAEAVEFDITAANSSDVTTCVVNVNMLSIGNKTHPCGNGEDVKLTDTQAVEILKLIQQERNAVKYSKAPKSLTGWHDSGLNLDEYLAVGDEVDEALVDEQMNCLPPRSMSYGYLQVGEPYSDAKDDKGQYRAIYATYHKSGKAWKYDGHCFPGEVVNRAPERDRIQEAITIISRAYKIEVKNIDVYNTGDLKGYADGQIVVGEREHDFLYRIDNDPENGPADTIVSVDWGHENPLVELFWYEIGLIIKKAINARSKEAEENA